MAQKNTQKNKSMCEESMQVMLNIIKLSSFSLANMSLDNKRHKNGLITIESFKSFSSNSHMNKRQAPLSKSYFKEGGHSIRSASHGTKGDCLDDDNFSDYIESVHKRNQNALNTEIKNGKATAYIQSQTFQEKNSRDSSLGSFPLVLPPPPPAGLKK